MSSPKEIQLIKDLTPALNEPGSIGLNIGCKNRSIGHAIGVDIDPDAKAAVIVADARALPIRSASLDYIVSCHSLEHLRDGPLPILREWVRTLKVGGTLALAVPNGADDPDRMLLYQVPHGKTIPGQHVHLFTDDTLASYLRCAGLDDVSVLIVGREPYWKSSVLVGCGRKTAAFEESPYRWRLWTWSVQVFRDVPWRARLWNWLWK